MILNGGTRRAVRGTIVAFAAAFAVATPATAQATPSASYNDADISIVGGRAAALSACINYAKEVSRRGRVAQSNYCSNFAEAQGGEVDLENVSVFVEQSGQSRRRYNSADINIQGGDATAVAACMNVLQRTNSARQTNECANTSVATGGNVSLEDVDITVIQG